MVPYTRIDKYFIHKFMCTACGNYIRVRIYKYKLPSYYHYEGKYKYEGVVTCPECETKNKFSAYIFYPIHLRRKGRTNRHNRRKKFYEKNYRHRIVVHCMKCRKWYLYNCKKTDCEFYGVLKCHKTIPQEDDLWWANPLKYIREHYEKWKKKKDKESKDSSTTPNTDTSSKS